MRIRNSRTSMPILPLAHEIVPNASHFRTHGPLIKEDVLVQERKPESGSTSRSSNCSRAQRDGMWSKISPRIVLALPKQSRPELVSNVETLSISVLEKELPLKKRMHYRPKVEKKDKQKQENTSEREGVRKRENVAVTEMNMDASMMSQEEGSGETNGGWRGKSICCIVNCESFIPCPIIDGIREKGKAKEFLRHKGEGLEKRRRGQPKKKSKRFHRGNSGLKKSKFILD